MNKSIQFSWLNVTIVAMHADFYIMCQVDEVLKGWSIVLYAECHKVLRDTEA